MPTKATLTKPKKRKPRKDAHTPTRESRAQVQAMKLAGLSQPRIAAAMAIARDTLVRHYRKELDLAMDMANSKVAATAYDMAISGDHPQVTIFWLKSQLGWKETQRVEVVDDTIRELAEEFGIDEETAIKEGRRLAAQFAGRRGKSVSGTRPG